jgi:hypothetical protein
MMAPDFTQPTRRTTMNREWPTREQWAEQQRAAYWDSDIPHPYNASRRLSDYATPDEIHAIIAELKALWSTYGREMKAVKDHPAVKRSDESLSDYLTRLKTMSETEKEISGRPINMKYRRSEINEMLKQLRNGEVPFRGLDPIRAAAPLCDALLARYEAAAEAGIQKYVDECAARPVDDAAWARELERRAEIEQWRAGGYGLGTKRA